MKCLVFVVALLGRPAVAQVFDCPKFYPYEDTVLSEVPFRHNGKGVIARGELTGARWMGGEFNDTFGVMQGPPPQKVNGGTDIAVPTSARWLVCDYSSGAHWWEELKLSQVRQCTLQVRDRVGRDPKGIRLVCK